MITAKNFRLIPLSERYPDKPGKYIILSQSTCKTPLLRHTNFVEAKMIINVHPKTKEITKSFDVNNQEPIGWLEFQKFNRKEFFCYRLEKIASSKLRGKRRK